MDLHCQMIMDEFFEDQSTFEAIKNFTLAKIKSLLSESGILVTAVEGRVKEAKSLAGKLELKGSKYNSLSDITDIVGCRVITFYAEEVDKIAAIIEKNFDIDWENSVDKRKLLDTDQFGYMSLHYVCRIPESLFKDTTKPKVNQYRFEIQMRTALQHVWATAYHDTGYKSDIEIPKEYIRALSRLAGVLEIADKEFSSILGSLAEYRRKIHALVKDGKFSDLDIDSDTFRDYLALDPFGILNRNIASINKAEIQEGGMLQYIEIFKRFGFKTLQDIQDMIKNYSDDAYRLAILQLGDTDIDILMETIGVQNLMIVYLIKKGFGEGGVKLFYDSLYGERERNIEVAKDIVEKAKKISIM